MPRSWFMCSDSINVVYHVTFDIFTIPVYEAALLLFMFVVVFIVLFTRSTFLIELDAYIAIVPVGSWTNSGDSILAMRLTANSAIHVMRSLCMLWCRVIIFECRADSVI